MSTRTFFNKGRALALRPPKVKPPPKRKILERAYITVEAPDGKGVRQYRTRYVNNKLASQKGGQTAQARGTGYRWDSASASKAAKKVWRTRWRVNKRLGVRVCRKPKNRPAVNHVALRAIYAGNPVKGIVYVSAVYRFDNLSELGHWTLTDTHGTRRISERTALTRLGHLPSTYIPVPLLGGATGVHRAKGKGEHD